MAFKPLSVQRDYSLIYSGDPALDLPDVPTLPDDASPEDIAARDAIAKDRDHKLKVARDHGNWPLKPGMTPTRFHLRNIYGDPVDWLHQQYERRNADGGPKYSHAQLCTFAFRMAIKAIENFDNSTIVMEEVDGQRMAKLESLETLYQVGGAADPGLGRAIVQEIGAVVIERSLVGVRPL